MAGLPQMVRYAPVPDAIEMGQGMSDEYSDIDEGYIVRNWKTLQEAADMLKITKQAAYAALKRQEGHLQRLEGALIRGRWFVDPESIKKYVPGRTYDK